MESKINELEGETNGASQDSFTERASEMLHYFFKTVKEGTKNENQELTIALIKFIKRFESFSQNQKVSAFQSFGSTFFGIKQFKIGSQQRQSNVATKSLPNRPISLKRKHNIKEIVDMNVPYAKKAGRSMVSNRKYFTKTKSKF